MAITQNQLDRGKEALIKLSNSSPPAPKANPFRWPVATERILLVFCAQRTITVGDFPAIVEVVKSRFGARPTYAEIRERVNELEQIARMSYGRATKVVKWRLRKAKTGMGKQ